MKDINATKCAKTKIKKTPVMVIVVTTEMTRFEPNQYIGTEMCSNQ